MAPATPSPKQQFLDSYEHEHARTMRLLRAFPADKTDLKPHARLRSARELAWVFVMERGLGTQVMSGQFGSAPPSAPPPAPAWKETLAGLEKAHKEFGDMIREMPDTKLQEPVKFLTGPKHMSDIPRMQFLWFMLSDQIHHRGQLSVYLRLADGKVPSIYGPSGDEPWM